METNLNIKHLRAGILILLFILFANQGNSQTVVCEGEEVTIKLSEYRGDIQWEKSLDNLNWELINGEISDSINLIASDSLYFRALMTEGNCNTYYTPICSLYVYPEVNILLPEFDSVCIGSDFINLSGAEPQGGLFSGNGVFDGRFLPSQAGAGDHTITYTFQFDGSECIFKDSTVITVLPTPTTAFAGEDSTGIISDSIQLYANIATTGTGEWEILSGTGGNLQSINNPNTFYSGEPGEHILVWSIHTDCGYSSDTVRLIFIEVFGQSCPDTPIVTDINGNIYKTVQIGNRCWMGENLRTGTFIISDNTGPYHSDVSNNGIIEKYCFNNVLDSCEIHGGLYDWDEAMNYGTTVGTRGICPEGWHIPSYDDWIELDANYALGQSGKEIKIGGSSGYEGQLSGDRHASGNFYSFNASGFFWTSTQYDNNEAWFTEICYCNDVVDKVRGSKLSGMSIRCIKDN